MNPENAWKHFAETGRIADYLLYREAKNAVEPFFLKGETENVNEVQNRRSDPEGTGHK